MKFPKLILILPLLGWGFDAVAQDQVPEQMPVPGQWQLTLDEIKSKAQELVVENNGLEGEYRQLIEQMQGLEQSIDIQQDKNGQMERYLKERNGRTDQQLRIEELAQNIKAKTQQAGTYEEQLGNMKRKQSDLEHKIRQMKDTISNIELQQEADKQKAQASQSQVVPEVDDQLVQLHKQAEDENKQEALLENELDALKTGSKTQHLNVDAIDLENKQLEARLDFLRLQKLHHEKASSDTQLAQSSARMYAVLKSRKEELEAKIYAYESRMDDLRQSSLIAMSWPLKKKKLVHEMVQMDARNNRMRDTIKILREDIDVLKDQVARLERRVDFAHGNQSKDVTFTSEP